MAGTASPLVSASTVSTAPFSAEPENGNVLLYFDADFSGDWTPDDDIILDQNHQTSELLVFDGSGGDDTDGDGVPNLVVFGGNEGQAVFKLH